MTHVPTPSTAGSQPPGSLLGDLVRFAVLVTLTLALVVGAFLGLGGTSEASTSSQSVLRSSVVHLTNVQRVAHGCRALKYNTALQTAAQRHANDMARKHYFSHNSLDGTPWWKVIMRAGYKDPGGQNIARGFSSPSSVVRAWLNSPSHRKNIMNCQFRTIGIGFNGNGDYWVQDFGY
ncbi:MAG TPA: CAP domain-containing protein [Sporichthya sp.]|nr:CAP domain-containing protein [Sporichthya sp.]